VSRIIKTPDNAINSPTTNIGTTCNRARSLRKPVISAAAAGPLPKVLITRYPRRLPRR
jgi:hypothetical protein